MQLRKKLLAIICFLFFNQLEAKATVEYAGGDGTAKHPFLIETVEQLNYLRIQTNEEKVDTSGIHYRLISDIDLSTFDSDDNSENGNWTPIGGVSSQGSEEAFKGHFDGDGYTISNLSMVSDEGYLGLFGQALFGSIKNLKLENVSIKKTNNNGHVGGLVGLIRGTIENVEVSGTIEYSGIGGYVGGVVGRLNLGHLKNVRSSVDVLQGAGLVGHNYNGTIETSFSFGRSSKGVSVSQVNGTFDRAYWDTEQSGTVESAGGVGLTTAQLQGEEAKLFLEGFDFNRVWTTTMTYPKLISLSYAPNPPSNQSAQITDLIKDKIGEVMPDVAELPVLDHLVGKQPFLLGQNQDELVLLVFSEETIKKQIYATPKDSVVELEFEDELIQGIYSYENEQSRWKIEDEQVNLNQIEFSNVVFSTRTILFKETSQGVFYPSDALFGKGESSMMVNGDVASTILSVTIPTSSLEFVINPNLDSSSMFVAPELVLSNYSMAPLQLELSCFEEKTSLMNNVLPSYHSDWGLTTKKHARDLALSIQAQSGDGWLSLETEKRYVADLKNPVIGVVKPYSDVTFTFDAFHSSSVDQLLLPQYRLIFNWSLVE